MSTSVIISTSNIDLKTLKTHPIQKATDDIFLNCQGVTHIREAYKMSKLKKGIQKIHPTILEASSKKHCVMLNDSWQMEYYLNKVVNKTERVLFVGIGWNMGLRRNPTGWGRMCEMRQWKHIDEKLIIATTPNSILVNTKPLLHLQFLTPSDFKRPLLKKDSSWNKQNNYYYKIDNVWNTSESLYEHLP
jgi:hypothetical protein